MEHVSYEVSEGVATLTLRRPDKLNAMNDPMRRSLREAFERFESDRDAKVAILTGEGRAFCAGADLGEMADTSMHEPPPLPHLGHNVHVSKPTIAQVNGIAFAGGFLLAQMCDLCTAAQEARFALTEVRWGRGTPWATPLIWMLPQRVMMELLLTGEPITATRAYELGFVNRVVPAQDLASETMKLARTIAANAPLGVKAGREMTYLACEMGRSAALPMGDYCFKESYASEDAVEGPRAFRDGRKPNWQGR